ncbi:MAG: SurA N-terminal domain-containing protein [Candidatus Aadella gelida]|nr:SurA N-terminal domain-containing protein [Candidatus Aadella gelida]
MVLNILRSKKVAKKVLLGLLILIVPAFVLWGVGNLGEGPPSVGKISGRTISARDLAESVQGIHAQLVFSYYGDFQALNRILQNRSLINNMAWERLILLDAARRDKIKTSDKDLLLFISQHPLFRRNGVFDKRVYDYILRNNLSMEPRTFENLVKENIQVADFRYRLLKDIDISDEDVFEEYKEKNDKVTLSYLLIDKDLFIDTLPASSGEAKKYYANHESEFYTNFKIEVDYMEFSYENSSEKSEIAQKMKPLYDRLRKDPDQFEALTQKNGAVYKTTSPFSYKEIVPGITFLKAFRDAAFSIIAVGDVAAPVVPESGNKGTVYVIRKTKDLPSAIKPFADVKEEIEATLTEETRFVLAETKAAELSNAIIAESLSLEDAASSLGRTIEKTDSISTGSYIANIGPAKELVLKTSKGSAGTIVPPIKVKDGFVITRIEEVVPASKENFEKNKESLRANLISRKQLKQMEAWFQKNNAKATLEKNLGEL